MAGGLGNADDVGGNDNEKSGLVFLIVDPSEIVEAGDLAECRAGR